MAPDPGGEDRRLMLLQGHSHKRIARQTGTNERTARQHSVSVYRKAGLAGRAELAGFFLEGLTSAVKDRTSNNKRFLLEPAARSRPFGTAALRSRRLLAQASRPPAAVRNLERYVPSPQQAAPGVSEE